MLKRPSDPKSFAASHPAECTWQDELRNAIRTNRELIAKLNLDIHAAPNNPPKISTDAQGESTFDSSALTEFPVFVTESFLRKMRPRDWNDPLLRQVYIAAAENEYRSGFEIDAVGDLASAKQDGILQKYHGRALLIMTGACAIHCRYCFRRHFPYSSGPKTQQDWEYAIAELERDPSLHEIILSGGDPLMQTDRRLAWLVRRLEQNSNLKTIRLHTRLPIVLPSRVTEQLLTIIERSSTEVVIVVHANHPNEIDEQVVTSLQLLRDSGAILLNQSVLLAGINDDAHVLEELSHRLFQAGVLPYYLHQLDRVHGAAHFEVEISRGLELIRQLESRLPGYLVPKYVQEIAGESSKTRLS